MKQYAIIKSDEDGNCFQLVDDIEDFLKDPRGNNGVERFLGIETLKSSPNYWDEGDAVLVAFEVVIPKEKTKEWSV